MNPYLIKEPTAISFSGGRTSAYMLYRIMEAHDGKLPDDVRVVFANTGKEMVETLDFVQACSDNWGVDIKWLERMSHRFEVQQGRKKYWYEVKEVTHETASRKGEPFEALIRCRTILPNPVTRYCTVELKIRCISQYMEEQGFELPYTAMIGIRADEPRRAIKIHNSVGDQQDRICPLYVDGVTARDVGAFWEKQNFDLGLPNNNGVTDLGNCDLCFLKGNSKRMSIIRERPELADWWIEQERYMSLNVSNTSEATATFRKEGSYAQMKVIATDQGNLFDFGDDPSIPCFCGD